MKHFFWWLWHDSWFGRTKFGIHLWLLDRGIIFKRKIRCTFWIDADTGQLVTTDTHTYGGSFVPGQSVICSSEHWIVVDEHAWRDDVVVTIRRASAQKVRDTVGF